MKRKRVLSLVGSVCLILVLAALLLPACAKEEVAPTPVTPTPTPVTPTPVTPTPTPIEVTTWKFHYHEARTDPLTVQRLEYLSNAIEDYTAGRVRLELYYLNELVPGDEMLEACSRGVIDGFECYPTYWAGKLPGLANVEGGLAYSWRSTLEVLENYRDYGLQELATKEYAKLGLHFVTPLFKNPAFLWSKLPLYTLDDLQGLKARSVGSMALMLDGLGAATVYIPGAEIYSALMLGTVDAATWGSWGADLGQKFHEIVDYVVVDPPLSRVFHHQVYNMDSWEKLSERDQFLVTKAIQDYAVWNEVICSAIEDSARLEILAKNPTLTEIRWTDPAILARMGEVAKGMRDETAAMSPAGAEAVRLLENYLRVKGYIE